MAYYAKQNGVPVVFSELSQVQLKNSDIATTAGYISVMIPLSWAMMKSMGAGFLQCLQPFCFVRAQLNVAGGFRRGGRNYSFSNMQMENVSGYSWNTNSNQFGQMSRQLGNGGMGTQTGMVRWSGTVVVQCQNCRWISTSAVR
jgi:conjugal transfer mating pair stabilization protein TraG